ncbi:hypothetical protein NVP1240O_22 [Vibrio phage 1.240.O._10N.261.52.F8]|nr:hypothetical protein NVP1240O_22 [Vibrio phage 1.240.O._10N.261.52.F8]
MADCSSYPTKATAQTFKLDAETQNEVVTSENDRTNPASDGKTKLTYKGFENQVDTLITDGSKDIQDVVDQGTQDIQDAIENTIGKSYIGAWAQGVTTFTTMNEYSDFNGITYKPKSGVTLPYTAQTADPTTAPDNANVEPFSDVNSDNLGGLTGYQALSIADMIDGRTVGGQIIQHSIGQTWGVYGQWKVKTIPVSDLNDFSPVGGIHVNDFGAVADFNPNTETGTDSTQAFKDAQIALSKVSPYGRSGWGNASIILGRGNYLVNGTIENNLVSVIGLIYQGQGQNVSNIHTTIDSGGPLFAYNTLIQVSFRDITFIHVPQDQDKSTWTRNFIEYSGQGGGRNLDMENIEVSGFNTQIKFTGTLNADTTRADHCTFTNCNYFIDSENTQAVVNTYTDCTWTLIDEAVFYTAGNQQTNITSGNVVCDGTLIKIKDISGKSTPSRGYNLDNVKFEWTAGNQLAGGGKPKIIDTDGNFSAPYLSMNNSSLTGGPTPDPSAKWGSIKSGSSRLNISGGAIEGILELEDTTINKIGNMSLISFNHVELERVEDWIFSLSGESGAAFPNVKFSDCTSSGVPINHTLTGGTGVVWSGVSETIVVTDPSQARPSFFSDSSVEYNLYGQKVLIKAVRFHVIFTSNMSNKTLNVYSDSAKTKLVGSVSPSEVSITRGVIDIPVTGNETTSDGIYCDLIIPSITLSGYFSVDIVHI